MCVGGGDNIYYGLDLQPPRSVCWEELPANCLSSSVLGAEKHSQLMGDAPRPFIFFEASVDFPKKNWSYIVIYFLYILPMCAIMIPTDEIFQPDPHLDCVKNTTPSKMWKEIE